MQTLTKMAPLNPFDLLSQMADEYYILMTTDTISEDRLKDYRDNCDNPDDDNLVQDIQQFEHTRFIRYAAECRSIHPSFTDVFMRSKGFRWGTAEEWGTAHYFC